MLQEFFLTINTWMTGAILPAAAGCFLWGMVSVLFSPCHLASMPLIVAYVGGQDQILETRKASLYAVLFTLGLFITIAAIGVICALLGRMLGDIGNYWQIIVGFVLCWIALGMLGVESCSVPNSYLHGLRLKGFAGAFVLGLAYGILSGSCTFGFIAPILAIIAVQHKIAIGILFIILFAIGHCLPIVVAGSSTALVRRFLESSAMQGAGGWFRRGAGVLIGILGIYFIANPFFVS